MIEIRTVEDIGVTPESVVSLNVRLLQDGKGGDFLPTSSPSKAPLEAPTLFDGSSERWPEGSSEHLNPSSEHLPTSSDSERTQNELIQVSGLSKLLIDHLDAPTRDILQDLIIEE